MSDNQSHESPSQDSPLSHIHQTTLQPLITTIISKLPITEDTSNILTKLLIDVCMLSYHSGCRDAILECKQDMLNMLTMIKGSHEHR